MKKKKQQCLINCIKIYPYNKETKLIPPTRSGTVVGGGRAPSARRIAPPSAVLHPSSVTVLPSETAAEQALTVGVNRPDGRDSTDGTHSSNRSDGAQHRTHGGVSRHRVALPSGTTAAVSVVAAPERFRRDHGFIGRDRVGVYQLHVSGADHRRIRWRREGTAHRHEQ